MKKCTLFFALALLMSSSSFSQQSESCDLHQLSTGNTLSFCILGEASQRLESALFSHYPKTRKKGYIWTFKNIDIPGISEPITFEVHRGLCGEEIEKDSSACKNGFYFTSFTSEKYRENRLKNIRPTEQSAITIYIKKGRKYSDLNNESDISLIRSFLLEYSK